MARIMAVMILMAKALATIVLVMIMMLPENKTEQDPQNGVQAKTKTRQTCNTRAKSKQDPSRK